MSGGAGLILQTDNPLWKLPFDGPCRSWKGGAVFSLGQILPWIFPFSASYWNCGGEASLPFSLGREPRVLSPSMLSYQNFPTVGLEGAYCVRHGDQYPANPPSVTFYGIRREDSPSVWLVEVLPLRLPR